jgi:ribosomal RNA methyltransferase Nop2
MSDDDAEEYSGEEDNMEMDGSGEEDNGTGEDQEWMNENDSDDDDEEGSSKKETMVMNPTSVRERIDYALEILSDFKSREDKTQSRVDIIAALSTDLSEYYGYINELSDFLLDLFSPSECVEYMDASDRPRPMVIRTNTIKATRKDLMEALSKRGSTLEAVEWSKVAIKVTESSVPIGATPEYLAGYYMLQSAASLNPVMALAPQPGERILDMASAPGGKTSYIAQLMKNSGTIIANDLKPQRQKATVANLHRMGVKNAICCCYDGRKIPKIMKGFDRVLLDAPCSGLGVISRDQTVKLQRTFKDIQRIAHLQKELLCAAIDAVDPTSKTGGIVVYSTCSISSEENEQVVNYILQKRFVRLIETGLEVGKPGLTRIKERRFHPSLALTRRFYPHVHNMDGFYVAKLQKFANGVRGDAVEESDEEEEEEEEDVEDVEAQRIATKAAATKAMKESRKKEAEKKAESLISVKETESNGVKKIKSEKRKRDTEPIPPQVQSKEEIQKKNTPVSPVIAQSKVEKKAVPSAKKTIVSENIAQPLKPVLVNDSLPLKSPKASKILPAKSPKVSEELPLKSPKVSKILPAKSPKVSESLPLKSPKNPVISKIQEDEQEDLHKSVTKSGKKKRMTLKDIRDLAVAQKVKFILN